MDFNPRITADGEGHGWHCNFHFGYGHDVIEDATNEKSCVQALHYLISKADAEILDLEDELAMLQCQLKWAKSDEQRDPYEVCCATFKRKIDILTKSIKKIKNGNVLNEHDVDTTFKIQRPVERIYDIIHALIKQNFSVPDEQMGDLSNELDLLGNSGSLDIGTDLRQKETALESSAESRELMTDCESQYKLAETVSEESCSDTARYAINNSNEARDMVKIVDEVTGKTEVDAYEFTAEGRNGLSTCLQAYNNYGNSKSNALQHGEIEECVTGSKNSGSSSSPLSATTEVIVKVEVDNDDMSIEHVDSLCKAQDEGSADPKQCHQEVKDIESLSIDNFEITYGRKKSSSSAILKPLGQKVQRENLGGVRESNPKMLEPQGKIGKRKFPSNVNKLRQSNSPSELERKFRRLPETIWKRKPVFTHGNQPQLLGAKKEKLQGASKENASILSQEVGVPRGDDEVGVSKGDDVCAQGNLASKIQHEPVICLKTSAAAEGIASLLDSSPANSLNVESKSTILGKVETKESPAYDSESLREKLSQEPDFLRKLKVPELKEILKLCKVRGANKFKKEKMIEELIKHLNAT